MIESLENEMWKPVVGYENSHEVSNKGRLRSIPRDVASRGGITRWRGKLISARLDQDGYPRPTLQVNKKRYYKLLHRLVAMAYIPNPDNKSCVNHIDGNKLNNNVENLEWCTVSENNNHAFRTGLKNNEHSTGERCNWAKLKQWQVNEIRRDYDKKTCNQKILADRYGIRDNTVSLIINNKTWQK